jgi:hypothetical protein
MKEPPSPLPDDPRRRVQPRSDLGVMQTLGRIEHDPRALNVLPRPLLSPRDPDQLDALNLAEFDPMPGRARHHPKLQRARPNPFTDSDANFRTRLLVPRERRAG